MKNLFSGIAALLGICFILAGCGEKASSVDQSVETNSSGTVQNSNITVPGTNSGTSSRNAFRISGNIDDASQEGDVCDTTKEFTVPGTLLFKFTPTDPRKGTYTYSGPFNATGEGPYVIRDDGTMLVDGTGCIMGKCATYSHIWLAAPLDPVKCG